MCYSARITQDYRAFVKQFGATLSLDDFVDHFWRRISDPKLKMPSAVEGWFQATQNDREKEIKDLIDRFAADEAARVEAEIFKQRKRLADAERTLATKPTKAAAESKRIATNKVEAALVKLKALNRPEGTSNDSRRFFPGNFAPVMIVENGQRVIKPMRYRCRPAGKPDFYDQKFPGTYNARRDNLTGFWKGQFGVSHGVLFADAFYEHVKRQTAPEEASRDVILEFRPQTHQDMFVACLWSRWTAPGEPDLLSFAAITDDPPEEVAAAGHDRCVIPIKAEHFDRWLNPVGGSQEELQAILDDRFRPYYENREYLMAA